eukprot:8878108-Pyramimonas_sp.AAC.1
MPYPFHFVIFAQGKATACGVSVKAHFPCRSYETRYYLLWALLKFERGSAESACLELRRFLRALQGYHAYQT